MYSLTLKEEWTEWTSAGSVGNKEVGEKCVWASEQKYTLTMEPESVLKPQRASMDER